MSRVSDVKAHVKEHKAVYIAAGIGVVVGASLGVVIGVRAKPALISTVIKGNDNVVNNIVLNALGDPGNVVQCTETGTIYASQGQAARELGLSAARVSDHLNGKLPHVSGKHLKRLGKAGEVLA